MRNHHIITESEAKTFAQNSWLGKSTDSKYTTMRNTINNFTYTDNKLCNYNKAKTTYIHCGPSGTSTNVNKLMTEINTYMLLDYDTESTTYITNYGLNIPFAWGLELYDHSKRAFNGTTPSPNITLSWVPGDWPQIANQVLQPDPASNVNIYWLTGTPANYLLNGHVHQTTDAILNNYYYLGYFTYANQYTTRKFHIWYKRIVKNPGLYTSCICIIQCRNNIGSTILFNYIKVKYRYKLDSVNYGSYVTQLNNFDNWNAVRDEHRKDGVYVDLNGKSFLSATFTIEQIYYKTNKTGVERTINVNQTQTLVVSSSGHVVPWNFYSCNITTV